MEGWLKLHRSILDSFVFAHPTTLKIWIWMLVKANYVEKHTSIQIGFGLQQISLQPGQFIFGRNKAEEELSIDGSTIYKHVQKLKLAGNILVESNNHYTVITICNWETYQHDENLNVTACEQDENNNTVTACEHPEITGIKSGLNLNKNTKNEQPGNNRGTTEEQPGNTTKNNKEIFKKNISKEGDRFLPLGGKNDLPQKRKNYYNEKLKSDETKMFREAYGWFVDYVNKTNSKILKLKTFDPYDFNKISSRLNKHDLSLADVLSKFEKTFYEFQNCDNANEALNRFIDKYYPKPEL